MSASPLPADLANALVEQLPIGIVLASHSGTRYVSQGLYALLGYPAKAGENALAPDALVTTKSWQRWHSAIAQLLTGESSAETLSLTGITPCGDLIELQAQLSLLDSAGETTVLSLIRSLPESDLDTQSLSRLAFRDSLTGLPNRALFLDRLSQSLRCNKRTGGGFALLCIDLDGFKAINDTHGHETGDEVLRQFAAILQNAIRESDSVARLGGDEFILILQDTDSGKAALHVAANIHLALLDGLQIGPLQLELGASIGISAYPEHGHDMHALIAAADKAMYDAKRQGKGTSRYKAMAEAELSKLAPMNLNWSADMELGVDWIDRDHRAMVKIVNRLIQALFSVEEFAFIQSLMEQFISTTAAHFAREDRAMDVLSEEDRLRHQQEHAQALAELQRIRAKLEASSLSQTIQFLTNWVREHIRHSDRTLSEALLQSAP
ncbi:diguanylate cyclase domain-containing protein [Uliginosibacterium sediminicola]|uniref:Diguanylate cyclase n=1 Tax=Uliginosibacterium sediminicola TaxID=2024550 RepID=A0ABU9YT56_9RHOO